MALAQKDLPLWRCYEINIANAFCSPCLQLLLAGYPQPRLYWFKNGQPLKASDRILKTDKQEFHSLEIRNVTKADAGQYSTFVINSAGSAYSSARLVVKGRYCSDFGTCFSLFQCFFLFYKVLFLEKESQVKWEVCR